MNFSFQPPSLKLPIDEALPEIKRALEASPNLLLHAPPGTGKTTRVAPFAASLPNATAQPNASASKTILVQPRRIAARTAAARIAAEQGVALGREVGYQVRFDNRIGESTQLICMTPGILLRRLQSDPVLEDVSCIILDEFHERSLEYDQLLGMARNIQCGLREDLRIVIMSATIETDALEEYLPNCQVVRASGITYPVKIHYERHRSRHASAGGSKRPNLSTQIVDSMAGKLKELLCREVPGGSPAQDDQHRGDILAFLPGVGEIRRVAEAIRAAAEKSGVALFQLYGSQSPKEQSSVLDHTGSARLILATNVAETSLTIDGVTTVVDSGYARVQRVDDRAGLNRLELEPISIASADQRAGRAGRTKAGSCYRLWDEITGRSRPKQLDPEILRVELSSVCLQLACWGESNAIEFGWLTAPRQDSVSSAITRLIRLGALAPPTVGGDAKGVAPESMQSEPGVLPRVTNLGQLLSRLPTHPALAMCMLVGQALGITEEAASAAAILSERDVLKQMRKHPGTIRNASRGSPSRRDTGRNDRSQSALECDIDRRVRLFRSDAHPEADSDVDRAAMHQVRRAAEQLAREVRSAAPDDEAAIRALLEIDADSKQQSVSESPLQYALFRAFPDRVARRRKHADPRGVMVGGRGVKLEPQSCVDRAEYFLCLDADSRGSEARVRKAVAIREDWLDGAPRREVVERFFNPSAKAVSSRRRTYWFDLLIDEHPTETPADEQTARTLAKEVARRLDAVLPPKDKELHQTLQRARWLSVQGSEFAALDLSEERLQDELVPWCIGLRSFDEVANLPWRDVISGILGVEAVRGLDNHAPKSIKLPTGRNVLLSYEPGKPPILAARIQELFGWKTTPRLAGGKSGLLFHLLAPNGRCQQITDSLESFWANTYPSVRKELRGRYPKHAWPEDPHA